MITPINGRLLVQLKGKYENLETDDKKFGDSKTRGIVLAIAKDCANPKGIKVGSMVYFGAWEDTARYGDKDDQVLIKLEDIGGYSDE